MKQLLITSLITFLLAFPTASFAKKKNETPAAVPAIPVEVITVKKEPIPIWIEFTGKTVASKRVEVRARATGILEKVFFQEGAYVKKGTPLFEIEKDSYLDALKQAKAQRKRDQATLNLATANVKRFEPLVAEGLAPRLTLEEYQARKNELVATVEADDAAVQTAQLNLSYTLVKAPISGVLSHLNVDIGNVVGFGDKTVLTTMVANDPMYAYFKPTEEQFRIIRKFASKEVLDAQLRVPTQLNIIKHGLFPGKVDFNDNRVNPMTGTITMRASVKNGDRKLMEGTFVYVNVFVTDKIPFLMIPPNSVLEDQQGSFVYVANGEGTVEKAYVTRGLEGRHYLEVRDGLDDGAQVIITALTKLKPDMKIAAKDVTETKGVVAVLKKANMAANEE